MFKLLATIHTPQGDITTSWSGLTPPECNVVMKAMRGCYAFADASFDFTMLPYVGPKATAKALRDNYSYIQSVH